MTESFEIIIIGAGASGLSAAWSLTKLDKKIALFEQGKILNQSDFIPINKGGELQRYKELSYNPNIRKNDYDYFIDNSDSPIEIANYCGVGGSTVLFSAQYPRFHHSDFCTFKTDGVGADWPISYKDLKPYYELNEKITGVSGLQGDPLNPGISNLLPPVPLGVMGLKLAKAFKELKWHWWPAYSAINTINYNNRPKDSYTRPSNIGDPTGSKGSTDNTYLPLALNKGLILKKNCIVTKLNHKNKRITHIDYIDEDGKYQQAKAKIFIITCSGIGTPRLLLNSKSSESCAGVANSSRLVGKNLMLHPLGYVEGHYKENLYSNTGPQGCCILSQEFYKTNQERDFKRGYTFQVLRGPLPIESSLSLFNRKIINFGNNFWQDFKKIFNHTAHISIITEDFPSIENRVELNTSLKNKFNQPGVSIKYNLSNNSKRMLSHGLTQARKLLKKSGAYKTFAYGPVKGTGWHTLGTCKMGLDPKSSVVNQFGQTHDHKNLFILDSSIFPTSAGVNPAPTIQALSLYLSDQIKSRYTQIISE